MELKLLLLDPNAAILMGLDVNDDSGRASWSAIFHYMSYFNAGDIVSPLAPFTG
jgi:hypothetical protein